MDIVIRYLWLFPFVIHVAYGAATFGFFPPMVGDSNGGPISKSLFLLEWSTIVLFANSALGFMRYRMPYFKDAVLGVPNKQYWLENKQRRAELVSRLQHLLETVLVLSNIFFLGVYQWIYQSNVALPAMKIPVGLLIGGFIATPLILISFYLAGTVRSLRNPQ